MQSQAELIKVFEENPEWKRAWELIHQESRSVNLAGKAGTGKSTFLRALAKFSNKKIVLTAPTGIAALNIRGVTLHSFFGLPFGPLLMNDHRLMHPKVNATKRKVLEKMDVLVIDEISMVRPDILDAIDLTMRLILRNGEPFGGKQLLLVGDNFQLEPVVKQEEWAILEEYYEHHYFFAAHAFQKLDCETIELKTIYRQTDPYFIDLLNKVRIGGINLSDLDELNSRYETRLPAHLDEPFSIILASRSITVAFENMQRLSKLPGEKKQFKALITGSYAVQNYPTDEVLQLKEGAQVIMIRNDMNKRWVNGSLGRITNISEKLLEVELETGKLVVVEPEMWEQTEYHYDSAKKEITEKITGTFKQFPLKLAWAITVHKSQGLSFNKVILNMEGGAFAAGQLYVALSRCRSLEGLTLVQKIKPTDIKVSRPVLEFSGLGKYYEEDWGE